MRQVTRMHAGFCLRFPCFRISDRRRSFFKISTHGHPHACTRTSSSLSLHPSIEQRDIEVEQLAALLHHTIHHSRYHHVEFLFHLIT